MKIVFMLVIVFALGLSACGVVDESTVENLAANMRGQAVARGGNQESGQAQTGQTGQQANTNQNQDQPANPLFNKWKFNSDAGVKKPSSCPDQLEFTDKTINVAYGQGTRSYTVTYSL